jgi:hypothetical protein
MFIGAFCNGGVFRTLGVNTLTGAFCNGGVFCTSGVNMVTGAFCNGGVFCTPDVNMLVADIPEVFTSGCEIGVNIIGGGVPEKLDCVPGVNNLEDAFVFNEKGFTFECAL